LGKGATPSETVRSLLKKAGVFTSEAAAAPATAE
jgi:ribosomal protein S16